MTDFVTGEAGADGLLAPPASTHRIDFKRPPVQRVGPGHAGQAEARHKARPADGRETGNRPGHAPAPGRAVVPDSIPGLAGSVAVAVAEAVPATFLARRWFLTVAPLILADVLALAGCGASSMLASHALGSHGFRLSGTAGFPAHTVLALLPLLLAYAYGGLYPGIGIHPVIELQRIARSNTIAWLAVTATLLVTGAAPHWFAFFGATWLATIAAVPVSRALARRLCARRAWWGYPAVVIGSGPAAAAAFDALLRRPQCGLRPCGVIDPSGRGAAPGVSYPCRPTPPGPTAPAAPAAYAVVALPDAGRTELARVLETYRNRFPHLLVLSGLPGLPTLWRDARDCGGGLAGTELRNRLLLPGPRFVKRFADVVLTGAALLLGLPLLAAIAAAVKLTSRGPVLFGHTRLGRNGRRFKAWKFRTMRPDAADLLRRLLAEDPAARREWETDHKLRRDPRVTRIGEFLRKTSLDELPQLWNVLTGEMSLVGPRPIIDAEIPKYGDVYRLYGEVLPGITGLWQVSGRNNTSYPERIALDAFYVRNWSPWLDLHILARTIKTICRQEGAY